ncbi:hypothetical protein JW964_25205 [candidate division KSB1 bacterium]|nr:hypothetical protein [candidate division KSB1 bacterium]
MISQKNFLWILVIFLQIILLQNFSYSQNLAPSSIIADELNSSISIEPLTPSMKDTATRPVLPAQMNGEIAPFENQNVTSPAALKAGQLQNIRKIYQFEHEIYNEILKNQKNLNVT